ncbi:MAG: methyl-accepting chemotaxis protein [Pseudomonadales bacterium]|nr:methyl-accepting chemotaxis protein [Pseudomonadales bacterium]
MMFENNLSLKWKILSGVTLTSTLAVIISSVIFVIMELSLMQETMQTEAQVTAQLIGANSTGALAFSDSASATDTLGTLRLNKNILAAIIFDESGSSFASFTVPGNLATSLPSRPGAFSITENATGEYMELFEPISMDGDQIGSIYLRYSLAEQQALISNFFWSALGIVVAIIAMSLAISLLVQRSIVKPINAVVLAMRDIAEGDGDLTQRIKASTNDEVGQLAQCFNVFVERMQQVISKFSNSALNLTASAERLTEVTSKTASGASRQQSEIKHVAAAMAEMATTVEEVARNVGLAATDAESADNEASRGTEVVARNGKSISELAKDIEVASEVISKLQRETESIGSVLDVIRGIAEQTNLLALNAAIEAARAGEQGRGFAVVADEVRTLASRTQASTEEIQTMIEQLQSGAKQAVQVMGKGREQASTSVNNAAEVGESLQAIARAISVIRDMSTQIASASEEQSAVTIEIKQNINNISEVANETASGSNEISTGAEKLSSLALEMKTLVNQFKV